MAISNTRLTTTGVTTVLDSNRDTAVTTMIACNTGATDPNNENFNLCELTVFLVPSGSATGDGTTIVKSLKIPAGETVFFSDEKVVLSLGDRVRAQADQANLITITISTLPV